MEDENVQNVVNHAFNDNVSGMRDALYDAINDKIFDALEQRKQYIAQNLVNGAKGIEQAEFEDNSEVEEPQSEE
jgi:hypothetical protein